MELRNRIRKVKKPLPNLGGRATQLPPISATAFASSKRSFSTTNQINANPAHNGRKSNPSQMFASGGMGMNDLNQSSAGAIPINSMYAGDAEREAQIPPPLEGMEENEEHEENDDEMEAQALNDDKSSTKHMMAAQEQEQRQQKQPVVEILAASKPATIVEEQQPPVTDKSEKNKAKSIEKTNTLAAAPKEGVK